MPGREANLPWARMAEKKGGGEGRKMEKKKPLSKPQISET